MRLFTHNLLQCNVRGCDTDNFPLRISDAEMEIRDCEFNARFISNYLQKLDWPALLETLASLEIKADIPAETPEEPDEELLRTLHHVLFNHVVKNGKMTCRGCGHVYPIKDGIPNMLLSEDEI